MSTTPSSSFKLYYTPTSCGAASFISAHKAGLTFDSEQVSLQTHKTASGVDFYTINPKGNVPTVVVGTTVLNENSATLQYIADQAPESGLAPKAGTIERYQLINLLSYISSELHGSYGPLFYGLTGDAKEAQLKKLYSKIEYIEKHVVNGGKKFVIGNNFTVADSYLYIVLSWSPYVGVDFSKYKEVTRYFEGIKGLDFVQAAYAKMATLPAAK